MLLLTGAALSLGAAPQDYRKLVGQHQRVCGTVVEVVPLSKKCEVALFIGPPSDRSHLVAVVPQPARKTLPKRPEEYLHDDICVSGTIAHQKKGFFITVADASQIELIQAARDPFGLGTARPCDEGAQVPRPTKEVDPVLSSRARENKGQGTVELEVVVQVDGTVGDSRFVHKVHPELDEAALNAVRQWRFRPATVNGAPVPMVVMIELRFTLK